MTALSCSKLCERKNKQQLAAVCGAFNGGPSALLLPQFADISLLLPQLMHIAAGIDSISGDSKRPFLRLPFCKDLHYSFV